MDLTIIFLALLVLIVSATAAIFFLLQQKKSEYEKNGGSFLILQQQINQNFQNYSHLFENLRAAFDSKLSESNKNAQDQFRHSAEIIKNVTEQLTKLDATNRQVLDFQSQLQKLQDILKNPKQRGILGEYFLDTLLKNVFQPGQYQMQYKFKNGDIVDAVVFLGDKIIPIDSKFSLENYNRISEEQDLSKRDELEGEFKNDLKKRIDETAKYIRQEEGTTDYAFMFIPAEGIYRDLLENKIGVSKVNARSLLEYAARDKKVHIVSPTNFYVTLQSMWQGMNAFAIQERTKDILKNVFILQKHISAYEDYMKKIGGNLSATVNSYNAAYKELGKIDKDVVKLTGGEKSITVDAAEKPLIDE